MNRVENPIGALIRQSGGAKAIADAMREKGVKKIEEKSVYKWRKHGVHWRHWGLLSQLSGWSITEIYNACVEVLRNAQSRANKSFVDAQCDEGLR